MIIGVPKEIKDHEFRVGLTPSGASELLHRGHGVWIESQAGIGSGYSDEEYLQIGARITTSKEELFQESELIVKVKEPLIEECVFFQEKHILFTYLHLAASEELTHALMDTGCTAIAYETTEDENGMLPILYPMSEIAGRMAVQIGAHYLERGQGGRGVLLGGVPGVEAARVVILGAGVVGSGATRIAVGMGAQVTVMSVDLSQLRELDHTYPGQIATIFSTKEAVQRAVLSADVVIGAVMVRGATTPTLVSQRLVSDMLTGAVIVDVAIDQGGCVETMKPTTHSHPVYEIDHVIHYGVTNIPGIVPRTSTMALTHTTLPFIVHLVDKGIPGAFRSSPGLAQGVNVRQGRVTYQAVADAHKLKFQLLP